jgi:hypothetical protein
MSAAPAWRERGCAARGARRSAVGEGSRCVSRGAGLGARRELATGSAPAGRPGFACTSPPRRRAVSAAACAGFSPASSAVDEDRRRRSGGRACDDWHRRVGELAPTRPACRARVSPLWPAAIALAATRYRIRRRGETRRVSPRRLLLAERSGGQRSNESRRRELATSRLRERGVRYSFWATPVTRTTHPPVIAPHRSCRCPRHWRSRRGCFP